MNDVATRAREATTRDLWQSIPLECLVSALAIIAAGGLKLAGVLP